jgi:hypothetical protein
MPVHKRKHRTGKISWYYQFNAHGTTRLNRREVREFGFSSKQAAIDAEAARRVDEQKTHEMAKAGAGMAA